MLEGMAHCHTHHARHIHRHTRLKLLHFATCFTLFTLHCDDCVINSNPAKSAPAILLFNHVNVNANAMATNYWYGSRRHSAKIHNPQVRCTDVRVRCMRNATQNITLLSWHLSTGGLTGVEPIERTKICRQQSSTVNCDL